jgi:hypothetical protein
LEKQIIGHTTILDDFSKHLSIPDNKRILFSGPFGAGKTVFLQTFFKANPGFKKITLNPVDYSVTATNDIFEVIKHDLLNEIVTHFEDQISLEVEDFPMIVLAQTYIKDKLNFFKLAKPFFNKVYPGAAEVSDLVEGVLKVLKAFEDYKDQMKVDEEMVVIKYLSEQYLKQGSVRENDGMTALIRDLIGRIKESIEGQELVLIIDDLDRLDPEHVFRIINVFSAHHNSQTEINKFGFDKIMFVCDIENIRYMFEHKFGKNVDFGGYIDKFYSIEIFTFYFREHLKQSAKNLIFQKQNLGEYFEDEQYPNYLGERYKLRGEMAPFTKIFLSILYEMIDCDVIRIRNFERFKSYSITNYRKKVSSGYSYASHDHPFLMLIHLLVQFFPTYEDLGQVLEKLSNRFVSDYSQRLDAPIFDSLHPKLATYCMPFLMKDHEFRDLFDDYGKEVSKQIKNEHGDRISFWFESTEYGEVTSIHIGMNSEPKENKFHPIKLNPYFFIHLAFVTHFKKGGFNIEKA